MFFIGSMHTTHKQAWPDSPRQCGSQNTCIQPDCHNRGVVAVNVLHRPHAHHPQASVARFPQLCGSLTTCIQPDCHNRGVVAVNLPHRLHAHHPQASVARFPQLCGSLTTCIQPDCHNRGVVAVNVLHRPHAHHPQASVARFPPAMWQSYYLHTTWLPQQRSCCSKCSS